MNNSLVFDGGGFDDYLYWQAQDRQMLKKINLLIRDIDRNGYDGIGKPEPLKHQYQGWWSRRIDGEHRLVYRIEESAIHIIACRFHYGE